MTRWVLPLVLLTGCYHVGYEPDGGAGTTLAVPVFENRTLRRELEVALTRHVRRELLETTPILLEDQADASRVLKGAITEVSENPLILGRVQELLHSSVTVTVSFAVRDGAGVLVIGEDADHDGTPEGEFVRTGYAEFTPSRGESRETALEEALRDLAELVVAELAARDDDRYEDDDEPAEAKPLAFGRQVALLQRDADWFAVTVPAGRRLRATLYADGRERLALSLDATDRQGTPCADAARAPDRQRVEVDAGAEPRDVLLHVDGPGDGARYRLVLRSAPPEPE
jgi:hypothetical protein